MAEITVYSSFLCKYCDELKVFLKRNAVPFVEHDCQFDQQLTQQLSAINPKLSLPTLVAGDRVIIGFDPDQIREALHI